ncbi:MAG TPA: tellurite resistance TerB family protein [Polyangiaceae bacterium]|nr:tellurite resistance TerB family protein [Polyangiaceae bacterium]
MPDTVPPRSLLDKLAKTLREPAPMSGGTHGSLLTLSGAQYGSHQGEEDLTQPTGFDPQAAALFEAVVEGAYLVANADGEFDDTERSAFQHVVLAACGGSVTESQLRALLADLEDLLAEDGPDKRAQMVARSIGKPEQAREVLRIAALIAQISEGVSDVERKTLERLAAEFRLPDGAVDAALAEVARALAD